MSMVINPYVFGTGGGGGADPYWSDVLLLLGFPGANGSTTINDESSYARTGTAVADAQVTNTRGKFGGTSLVLDGTGDYVTFPDSPDWTFGTVDFTIEFFAMFNSLPSGGTPFIGQANASTGWQVFFEVGSFRFNCYAPGQVQVYETTSAWSPSVGVWYHLVAERFGTTYRLYRDGVMVKKATGETGSISNSTDDMKLGNGFQGLMDGWLDEVRVTKGAARYNDDGGFTVPAAAFPRHG